MDGHEQAVHVKNRQSMDEHVTALFRRPPTPVSLQHLCVAQQIAVCEHGPFAASRGATGVQDGRQVIHATLHGRLHIAVRSCTVQQCARDIISQREHVLCTGLEGQLADPSEIGRRAHHHSGFGIANEVLDLGSLVSRVQRQKNMPGP